jgi:ATP-binding protein involved in chromosome partitioning
MEPVRAAAEALVRALPGVVQVSVVLTAHGPAAKAPAAAAPRAAGRAAEPHHRPASDAAGAGRRR